MLFLLNAWYPLWNSDQNRESDFSIMTYNVRYFYDAFSPIRHLIHQQDPDVFLFQEMGDKPEMMIEDLSKDKKYFFENYNSLGIASKYPIIETNSIRLKKYPLAAAYADIALPTDTIRIINVYLESLHLNQEKIKGSRFDKASIKNNSLHFGTQLVKTSKIHQQQINLIRDLVDNCPYPVILAGDFNAVPNSYEYFALKKGLEDVFASSGNQIGNTFPSFKIPLKLDYIFCSKEFTPTSYKILKTDLSDHYPSIAKFKLPE